jgi:sarcinarray family protein
MKRRLIVLLLALLLATLPGEANGKSIKAYFNGQEATVSGIVLRQGEPFTVDLNITPDNEADAWAEIDEPGITRAYDRLGGDELMPTAFKRCNASTGARFHWELAASGNWVNGTAPVNIYYQINGRNSNDVFARGYFTVVEAYIIPGNPPAEAVEFIDKNVEKTPGPGAMIALAGIIVALLTRRTAS